MRPTIIVGIAISAFGLCIGSAYAQVSVEGYTRSDGTYVAPYMRSSPDDTVTNNYSYQGNTNPYTGETGTDDYSHDMSSPYYNGPDANGVSGHDDDDSEDNSDGDSDDDSGDGN